MIGGPNSCQRPADIGRIHKMNPLVDTLILIIKNTWWYFVIAVVVRVIAKVVTSNNKLK